MKVELNELELHTLIHCTIREGQMTMREGYLNTAKRHMEIALKVAEQVGDAEQAQTARNMVEVIDRAIRTKAHA